MDFVKRILVLIFLIGTIPAAKAQQTFNKKDIVGNWRLFKVEKADGSTEDKLKEPSFMYLQLKPGTRIAGPIWTGEGYGHFWGRYKFKNGVMNVKRAVTYYPAFMGKNGYDVERYLAYLRAAYSCERHEEVLVINFKKSRYGERSGKLYFKPDGSKEPK